MNTIAFRRKFSDILIDKCRVANNDIILVAFSGGADSMALLHLLKNEGCKCIAAHCNFHLRADESDADALFAEEVCNRLKVRFHKTDFDTRTFAEERGLSIEMAARQLRYDWFEKLMKETGATLLATGHHGNDNIETFFLNLSRGTGLKGLTGMSFRSGSIIRPLLFASADEIRDYCKVEGFDYRIDSTNLESDYQRNKIRNLIVPLFEELNPSFFATMQNNLSYLSDTYGIFKAEADSFRERIVAQSGDSILIPIENIKEHPYRGALLFEILQPYGFQGQMISAVIKSLDGIPGRQFFSHSHRLVVDRFNLLVVPITELDKSSHAIEGGVSEVSVPIKMSISIFAKPDNYKVSRDPNTAHFDAGLVEFPLFLRKSQQGDRFIPLGMKQFKKISDLFIDLKMSLIDKENSWLLCNGDDIMWVVGVRIDDRYKIRANTRKILEIKVNP